MNTQSRNLLYAIVVIVLVVLGYYALTRPDTRTGTEKLGDAIHDLDKGPSKAARQLENRTPGERLGDAIKDTGDDVKNATRR